MSEVNGSSSGRGEVRGLLDGEVVGKADNGYSYSSYSSATDRGAAAAAAADWRFQVAEFAKGAAEMSVEFGKGVRDVVRQSILRDDSIIVRKFKGPCVKILGKLKFLNGYLPEDRDPVHAWAVIASVWVVVLAVLIVNNTQTTTSPLVKKMKVHPPGASLILLPDGRRLAYQEQGVPADQARYSIIAPHSFLSSRLSGIPGIKGSILQEFGVRLVTYDLPGFGESEPHPHRDLESSALDMLHLSYALNISDRFWVLGYAEGSKHAWAALHYIPDRVAGAIMVAPMVNPYEQRLSKEERRRIWGTWTVKRKLMYFLARKFPRLLPYFYRRSFLSGNHGPIHQQLSLSLGKKDSAFIEMRMFKDFWERDVEESVRQGRAKPFVEEAVLQVSNWGFSIAQLNVQSKHKGGSIFGWIKSVYNPTEKRLTGLLGPIHIWQVSIINNGWLKMVACQYPTIAAAISAIHGGKAEIRHTIQPWLPLGNTVRESGAEDRIVPPSMSDFVHRVMPDVMLHKLTYEGHFTYFYFCNECHRQMLATVFGNPRGPLGPEPKPNPLEPEIEEKGEEVCFSCDDGTKYAENVSTIA